MAIRFVIWWSRDAIIGLRILPWWPLRYTRRQPCCGLERPRGRGRGHADCRVLRPHAGDRAPQGDAQVAVVSVLRDTEGGVSAKQPNSVKPESYIQVEAARNRRIRGDRRIFSFQQCRDCTRWFAHERDENAPEPGVCPLHDANAKAARERGRRLADFSKKVPQ